MKKIGIGILLLIISTYSRGQVLNGKIHEGLSESGIKNIRLRVPGYTDSKTDEFGLFSIRLPGAKRGSLVDLNVQKEGYAIINREALKPRVPAKDEESLSIFMCPASQRNELAAKYYKIQINQTIQRNFNEEAKILANQMNYEAIAELTRKKEVAEKMADSLAVRLAKFDPEKATEELALAMQLYREGKIDSALNLIDPDKIVARIFERKKANQRDLDALLSAAEIALTDLQFDRAQNYYEKVVEADSTNFKHTKQLVTFLFYQNKSDQLISYAKLMLRNSSDEFEKGVALNFLGIGFMMKRKYDEAIQTHEKALEIRKRLSKENPSQYSFGLAKTLGNISLVYTNLKQYDKAFSLAKQALGIYKTLAMEDPQNFEGYVALTLDNLGTIYLSQNKIDEALNKYMDALEIRKKLANKDPDRFEIDLTVTLTNLGMVYVDLKRYEEAFKAYEDALLIRRRLTQKNPEAYKRALASTLNNLGTAYFVRERYDEALNSYQESLDIRKKLDKENPGVFFKDIANSLNNLGNTYQYTGQYRKAESSFDEAIGIGKKLIEKNPNIYAGILGYSYHGLALIHTYQLEFPTAVKFFELADSTYSFDADSAQFKVRRTQIQSEIQRLSKIDALGNAFDRKGLAFYQVQEIDSAQHYFLKAKNVYEQIPFNKLDVQGHYNAYVMYEHLVFMEKTPQQKYVPKKQACKHMAAVYEVYPQSDKLKQELASAYFNFSWYALFVESFEEAEVAASKTLELDPSSTGVISNLTSALLFQGRYKKTKSLYEEWKDKPWGDDRHQTFGEVFLSDLKELEEAGLTHPDLEKARKLLAQTK